MRYFSLETLKKLTNHELAAIATVIKNIMAGRKNRKIARLKSASII